MREFDPVQELKVIQNFERYFSAPKHIPQNEYRVRIGLPTITREQIIIERDEQNREEKQLRLEAFNRKA